VKIDNTNAMNSLESRVDLAFQAFLQCRDAGQDVSISEFVCKYPDLQPSLQQLIEEALVEESRLRSQELETNHEALYQSGHESVPNYRLLRRIGQGSYGIVWLAEHRNNPGQFRAVKIIPKSWAGSETEIQGVREAYNRSQKDRSIISQFVIPIDAPGEAETYWYYVMELADNLSSEPTINESYWPKTLSNLLEQPGQRSSREVLHIGRDMCLALGSLHADGCLHRDVKPSNIMSFNGQWRLGDLGQVSRYDRCKAKAGTRKYAADDSVPNGDPLHDIIPLSKVLYESLSKDHDFKYLRTYMEDPGFETGEPVYDRLKRIIRQGLNKEFGTVIQLQNVIERALRYRPVSRFELASRLLAAAFIFLAINALCVYFVIQATTQLPSLQETSVLDISGEWDYKVKDASGNITHGGHATIRQSPEGIFVDGQRLYNIDQKTNEKTVIPNGGTYWSSNMAVLYGVSARQLHFIYTIRLPEGNASKRVAVTEGYCVLTPKGNPVDTLAGTYAHLAPGQLTGDITFTRALRTSGVATSPARQGNLE
jgi:serine/threonine protein kinase